MRRWLYVILGVTIAIYWLDEFIRPKMTPFRVLSTDYKRYLDSPEIAAAK